METVMSWLGILRRVGQKAGPYLLVEMLLPGGTLLALLLFLARRKNPDVGARVKRALAGAMCALGGLLEHGILMPAPIRVIVPASKAGAAGRRWNGASNRRSM